SLHSGYTRRSPTSYGGIGCRAPACWPSLGSLLQPTSARLVANAQAVRAGAQSFADIIIPPLIRFISKFSYLCAAQYLIQTIYHNEIQIKLILQPDLTSEGKCTSRYNLDISIISCHTYALLTLRV